MEGGDRETKGRERERETKTGWGSVPLAIAGPPLSGGTLTAPRVGEWWAVVVWWMAHTRRACVSPHQSLNFSDSPTDREIMKIMSGK